MTVSESCGTCSYPAWWMISLNYDLPGLRGRTQLLVIALLLDLYDRSDMDLYDTALISWCVAEKILLLPR